MMKDGAPAPAHVGYAIFDAERRLHHASDTFSALLDAHPAGTPLAAILPLFAGVDAPLQAVANSDLPAGICVRSPIPSAAATIPPAISNSPFFPICNRAACF